MGLSLVASSIAPGDRWPIKFISLFLRFAQQFGLLLSLTIMLIANAKKQKQKTQEEVDD